MDSGGPPGRIRFIEKMKGYTGKVLFVDLTQRSWHMETIPDEIYEAISVGWDLARSYSSNVFPGALTRSDRKMQPNLERSTP